MLNSEKKAFTLIELLVVISIIALLVAILMPSLNKARYQAKRVYCMANIKSQYLYQKLYATDNDDKYSDHADAAPEYAKTPPLVSGKVALYDVMAPYFEDSFEIMLCPLQLTSELKAQQAVFGDVEWLNGAGTYGGWGSVKPGQNPDYIFSGYMWLANYTSESGDEPQYDNFTIDGETVNNSARWPRNDSEATSRSPFIMHRISSNPGSTPTGGVNSWDSSHGGKGAGKDAAAKFEIFSRSEDNPLGYGDGSVTYHNRSEMKPRVQVNSVYGLNVYYY
ncbi:MAG: type II secretion system protein [Desulfobulbaceae bacterium]|nr:type II secretion system protein [Desulfobulbaceae bacterium]